MDAPFEKKEEFEAQNSFLMERGSAAVRALRFYEKQILNNESEDQKVCIDLSGRFLSARFEVDFNISDAESNVLDEEDAKRIKVNKALVQDRQRRGIIETAIRDAQFGNYSSLKRVLVNEAERIRNRSNVVVEDWEKLPVAIIRLVQRVPEKSDHHFRLPGASYLDPRFNPNASPLPSKID
jgi:hypothetical protein